MPNPASLSPFAELLHQALEAQKHAPQGSPEAVRALEEACGTLQQLLEAQSPIVLRAFGGLLWHQGVSLEESPEAAPALARLMEERRIGGLSFREGVDEDELHLLLFALQLQPERLEEMGGAGSLMTEDAGLQFLDPGDDAPPPLELDAGSLDVFLDPITDPFLEVGTVAPPMLLPPVVEEIAPALLPPSPEALIPDLRALFSAIVQMTGVPPQPKTSLPWSSEQREVVTESGFLVPDFASVIGTGEQLGLGRIDPIGLRNTLRTALAALEPMVQGAILVGLPSFPAEEQALRRALDYLAPELLAQSVADVHARRKCSKFELALAVSALLQCVKDRELALEALHGRLQFEGWDFQELESLKDAILWECHGTDTKLQMSLMDRGVFDLDAHQVMILNRQLLHGKRLDGVRDLLSQLETGFASPEVKRRRHAAEIVADFAECLPEAGLPHEFESRLLKTLDGHIDSENDSQALLWSCQAMEALLGHWIRRKHFEAVYKEMLSLAEFALAKLDTPPWKAQAVRDLLTRLASPTNLGALTDILIERDALVPIHQLHALLALLGRPAAQFLATRLGEVEEKAHRQQILAALRAIGRNAVPALREALTSPHWHMVGYAVSLLGEINHKAAFEDVAQVLNHPEARVRQAAIHACVQLGDPEEAAAVIAQHLPSAEPTTQLDALAALGELKVFTSVPAISELLRNARGTTEEVARIRLRAVEVLGQIGSAEAVETLQELFRKKGFLGGRETPALRLAAAKALAAINTREAREAMALAMDQEPLDEVKAVLRRYLVGNS